MELVLVAVAVVWPGCCRLGPSCITSRPRQELQGNPIQVAWQQPWQPCHPMPWQTCRPTCWPAWVVAQVVAHQVD